MKMFSFNSRVLVLKTAYRSFPLPEPWQQAQHACSSLRLRNTHCVNGWYEGPSEGYASQKSSGKGQVSRRLRPDQPRSPQLQSRQSSDQDEIDGTDLKSRRDEIQAIPYAPLDGFAAFSERLRDGSRQGFVINKEAWSKLFYLIETPEDACATMELMLSDAAVRDSNDWDWNTQGYGQTVFQLIQACAAVREYSVCDWVIKNSSMLKVTVGNDTIPNMLRKVSAGGADIIELQRLYSLEKTTRGCNSNAGFYEMFKVLKRERDAEGIRCLLTEAQVDGVKLKESLLKEVEAWLLKQGH